MNNHSNMMECVLLLAVRCTTSVTSEEIRFSAVEESDCTIYGESNHMTSKYGSCCATSMNCVKCLEMTEHRSECA
jgi:hypothetical protein